MRPSTLLVPLLAFALMACGGEDDGDGSGGSAAGGGEGPGSSNLAFSATLTGGDVDLPDPSGGFIITADLGAFYAVDMTGTNETIKVSLDGDGADGAPGSYAPYTFTVFWVEEQYTCGNSKLGGTDLEMTFTIDAQDPIIGSFEGDVTCSPLESSEPSFQARIEGTFDDS